MIMLKRHFSYVLLTLKALKAKLLNSWLNGMLFLRSNLSNPHSSACCTAEQDPCGQIGARVCYNTLEMNVTPESLEISPLGSQQCDAEIHRTAASRYYVTVTGRAMSHHVRHSLLDTMRIWKDAWRSHCKRAQLFQPPHSPKTKTKTKGSALSLDHRCKARHLHCAFTPNKNKSLERTRIRNLHPLLLAAAALSWRLDFADSKE